MSSGLWGLELYGRAAGLATIANLDGMAATERTSPNLIFDGSFELTHVNIHFYAENSMLLTTF